MFFVYMDGCVCVCVRALALCTACRAARFVYSRYLKQEEITICNRENFQVSLYEWVSESLIHSIHLKHGFIQKLNTAVLLGDAQQFCSLYR